jgi:hypothetical protein
MCTELLKYRATGAKQCGGSKLPLLQKLRFENRPFENGPFRPLLAPYLKIFFGDHPPPVAKKIFGQCTILGVKKFFRTYHNFS